MFFGFLFSAGVHELHGTYLDLLSEELLPAGPFAKPGFYVHEGRKSTLSSCTFRFAVSMLVQRKFPKAEAKAQDL